MFGKAIYQQLQPKIAEKKTFKKEKCLATAQKLVSTGVKQTKPDFVTKKCVCCGKEHTLADCEAFAGMNYYDRQDFVRNN